MKLKNFFLQKRHLMVPKAFNTRFSKIVFDFHFAQPAMQSIPHMLSQRRNSFCVCSVCDEIRSAYAQHGFTCKNCSHFPFLVCSVCDEIVSSYAQYTLSL
jgi:hypothetical protein